MRKHSLAKKDHTKEIIDRKIKTMQEYIQECHLSFYNFFRKYGVVSDFIIDDLPDHERQQLIDQREFMHKHIIEQLKKGRNFKNYILIVLYIKNYLNMIFPFIKKDKVDVFIQYGLKLLAFQVNFFKQLQRIYRSQTLFRDLVHSLPDKHIHQEAKSKYLQKDSIIHSILSVELAMMR